MKWCFLILLVIGLGFWIAGLYVEKTSDSADTRLGSLIYYGLGTIFLVGNLLILLFWDVFRS